MLTTKDIFLSLVRQGIGHQKSCPSVPVDWTALKVLADNHGLTAVVLDGINSLCEFNILSPPRIEKLQWIGEVDYSYERYYAAYREAISSLAGFYNQHGFKMMVLKGYACSLDWPKPNHRPCGDIDIWLFGKQKEADAALEEWFKSSSGSTCSPSVQEFKIDSSHHHHTVFSWNGFAVENHYDFMNVHYGHRNKELEATFKRLAKDDSYFVEVNGEKVYFPSPNLHALFLLRHSLQDFAAATLTLRQVLDWGFFVKKHTDEINWDWLRGVLAEYRMTDFFNYINAICVEDLYFSPVLFDSVQYDPFLKEKVLNDIVHPAYTRSTRGRGMLNRVRYKYRRWQGNAWKQELCYHDNRWKSFCDGVWNHLLKPKSI